MLFNFTPVRRLIHALLGGLLSLTGFAQNDDDEFLGDSALMMDAFNVSVYGGEIPIIDGISGKKYKGDHPVVIDFALSFNKLLLGYHKKLVVDEYKHMEYRLKLGDAFETEMNKIGGPFGFKTFKLNRTNWMSREKAIVSRLINKPFFRINSLIAWDLDQLNETAPNKPKSKHAVDIHFNPESQTWDRRVTARWNVFFHRNPNNPNNAFVTHKDQGLNLDTNRGFHLIEQGLPGNVPPHAFKEVKLTYPIFYSDSNITEEELFRLQQTFVANLYHIYDPFSWVARRDTRFRGGFRTDCQEFIEKQKIPVSDRKYFDTMFSRFLSDVVTIRLQGAEEIYDLHMVGKRFGESPSILGTGLDLLNWNPKEKREAQDKPESVAKLHHNNGWGFRYVMIDAYQQFGNRLLNEIYAKLTLAERAGKKINGKQTLQAILTDLSGMPFNEYGKQATQRQEAFLADHRVSK
jgi:hypothetical protein